MNFIYINLLKDLKFDISLTNLPKYNIIYSITKISICRFFGENIFLYKQLKTDSFLSFTQTDTMSYNKSTFSLILTITTISETTLSL